MPKHPDWNPDIEPGQPVVFISGRGDYCSFTVRKVERLTKTQVILERDTRLDRATGRQVRTQYAYWQPFNLEVKERMEYQKLRDWVRNRATDQLLKLTRSELEAIKEKVKFFLIGKE